MNLQRLILPNVPVINNIHHVLTVEHFVKIILFAMQQYKNVYLWAHNGGKWDHHIIYPYLATGHEHVSDLSFYDIEYPKHKWLHFRDTRKFFPGPLSDLGHRVKSPKMDMPYEECTRENLDNLLPYCRQDVNILNLGFDWLQTYVIPIISPSSSIFAFNSLPDLAWYKCCQYIKVPTFKFECMLDFKTLKDCFQGGRVFSNMWGKRITTKIQAIDVKSMYANAMLGDLPYGPLLGPVSNFPPGKLYIALCTLTKEPQPCIKAQRPLMPFPLKTGGIAYIDSGKRTGWFTSVDIQTFQRDGWVIHTIMQVFYWEHSAPYLRDYFLNGYQERLKMEKGSSANLAMKLLLNSAYGKFTQFKVGSDESILNREHYIGWFCLAYSRRILFLLKQLLSGPAFYGDTDSDYMLFKDAQRLKQEHSEIFTDELGDIMQDKFSVELEEPLSEMIVLGKKAYGGIKESGQTFVKFKGQPDVKYEQLINVLSGKKEYSRFKNTTSHFSCKGYSGLTAITEKQRLISINIPPYYRLCNTCQFYHASSVVDQ